MPELVMVIVIVGVLAAFVMPKMMSATGLRDDAWRDAVVSAMRYAQKSAVSHRRLVCASVASTSITLTIASTNPATSCDAAFAGPDGSSTFASASNSSAATTVSPAGMIYFQPDGRVTTDGSGTTSADRTLTMYGVSAVVVLGETGYVQ
jgi:MSHA pilin protein MshC